MTASSISVYVGWFKKAVMYLAAVLATGYGLEHLITGLGLNRSRFDVFVQEGSTINLLQAFALLSSACFLCSMLRREAKKHAPTPPRDEAMSQAIRERAVDNLIAAQRESGRS